MTREQAIAELHRSRLATDAFRSLVEAQTETIKALGAKVADLEAQLAAYGLRDKAIAELKGIVPEKASISIQDAYWFHPERQEGERDVVEFTVSVLTEGPKGDWGFPTYEVEFQEMSTDLTALAAQCRAHFQPGEAA